MNDTIQYSSRYYDNCTFRASFNKHTNIFSLLNANIKGMATNLDKFKFLLDDLDHPFPIIGLTETWLKPHNVDCFFIKDYSHEYNLRPKRAGGGVSFFISNTLMYSRKSDVQFNPVSNSIIIDIEQSELRSTRHMSVILVYRPPNTDSSIFINDLEKILSKLDSQNRDIFMIGDFNYVTFKISSFKPMNIESEIFTNRLAEFNMYKLIHKHTRVKPPSAPLLDNIYTNIQITIDNCESGILTSNISDHFFVFFF